MRCDRNACLEFSKISDKILLSPFVASPGIGLSARLKSNVKVPASAATVIAGWDSSGYFIFFEYGIKLVEKDKGSMVKGSVVLPIKGLFLVSASLMLDSKQDMKLEVCITKDICQQTEQNEHTVTVAIQNYFPKDEVIYIRIYAIEQVTLLRLSSFSVQYLGPFSMMAGFLAALDQDTTLVKRKGENFVTVKDWLKNAENGVRREQEPTLKGSSIFRHSLFFDIFHRSPLRTVPESGHRAWLLEMSFCSFRPRISNSM